MKTHYLSILKHPYLVIVLCLLPILLAASFLPALQKDIRSDAFLAKDNPALAYRKKIKEQFGLSDPLVVAVYSNEADGVFDPGVLSLLDWLSTHISALPNIDASKTVSLSTEKNITATSEGMEIRPFLDPLPETESQVADLRRAVMDFPLYVGSIVSPDGRVALIVAEMVDENLAGESYHKLMALLETAPVPTGVTLHVAGEGAIIGFLGEYVDADARQLVPFAGLVIFLILVLAYRAVIPALVTSAIVLACLIITIGTMIAFGIPFYVITNALPVILIGISVADALHIYSHYFELQSRDPDRDVKDLIGETMVAMWRPVTLTSLTTLAGFLGLAAAGYMPPFQYFGLFAALGVIVAWFYSLVFLPAIMVITRPKASARYLEGLRREKPDFYQRMLSALGVGTMKKPRLVIMAYLAFAVLGFMAASQLIVDEDPVDVFHDEAPVAQADRVINEYLNGSNTLDVIIETPNHEDLFLPRNLQKIEAIQQFADGLPYVGGSVSIVDYLKQINRAVNNGSAEEYRLPGSSELAAQYFLLYAAMSDPTDFEEEVDYDYQNANIRFYLNSGNYKDIKVVINALETYINEHFDDEAITATLSGRVAVNYHWIDDLAKGHFVGLGVSLILVFLITALLFRSFIAGIFVMLPVVFTVLLIYGFMAISGVTLGMGTSMFAAITVGLGVDFSIHTVERVRAIYGDSRGDLALTLKEFYPTTGRALLFNFLAVSGGFAVLMVSKISSLNVFGAVVAIAVSASFISSLTLLPALIAVYKPNFVSGSVSRISAVGNRNLNCTFLLLALLAAAGMYPAQNAFSQELSADEMMEPEASETVDLSADEVSAAPSVPVETSIRTGDDVVKLVNAVPEGEHVVREIEMTMTDGRGKTRSRKTVSFRKNYEDHKRTVLFYLEPANVRNTGFLIWDYVEPDKSDDQWLYLPAMRKVRRISASDRGDYFLGTDFTYEDMKLDGKLEHRDYNFSLLGTEQMAGVDSYKIEATPKTQELADELGYSRTVFWVSPANWMITRAEFWDVKAQPLKILTVPDIRNTGGVWTRHKLVLENLQTGHRTEFLISNVDYETEVPDETFTKAALERGR